MGPKKLILAAAAVSLTVSPVLAANPAAKLAVTSSARAHAKAGKSNLFENGGLVVALVAAAAVVAGVIVIADNSNSDSP